MYPVAPVRKIRMAESPIVFGLRPPSLEVRNSGLGVPNYRAVQLNHTGPSPGNPRATDDHRALWSLSRPTWRSASTSTQVNFGLDVPNAFPIKERDDPVLAHLQDGSQAAGRHRR